MKIRGSEYQDFLRCRKRWDYGWRQNLVPKQQNDKLAFGTAMHKFLEVLYSKNDYALAEQAMFDEICEDGELLEKVARHYFETVYQQDLGSFQVIETEYQFSIQIGPNMHYTGTIDMIVRDVRTGDVYFMDHKTTKSIDKYVKNSEMDRQISRYWWALQELGFNPKGFIYNIILKDHPEEPTILKSGLPSKAKSQNTTYEIFSKYLLDNNIDLEEYKDILDYFREYPKEYFKRIEVIRTQAEIDASIEELVMTADDMVSPLVYRNITSDCHWDCQFKDLCLAEMDGSNAQYLVDALYEKRETDIN